MNSDLASGQFCSTFYHQGKGVFHINKNEIHLEAGDLFLLPKNMVTYYRADAEDPWSYYWIGISGTKVSDFTRFFNPTRKRFLKKTEVDTERIGLFMEQLVHKAEDSKMTSHYQLHLLSSDL